MGDARPEDGGPAVSPRDFLRRIPIFAELAEADIDQLCRTGRLFEADSGDILAREGAEGNSLYVILTGELEVTKREGGQEIVLVTRRAGEFIGEMSLLMQAPRTATVRAASPSRLLEIRPEAYRSLLARNPAAAAGILRVVAGRLRSTEASLVQREKLASLGTLAAGLAHELNNPAAAIQRSSDYLSEGFRTLRRRMLALQALSLSDAERQALAGLEESVATCGPIRSTGVEAAGAEDELVEMLEALALDQPWEIVPAMVAYGWTAERLRPIVEIFAPGSRGAVLSWFGTGLAVQQLTEEIRTASKQISAIVHAVKSYAFLDQAPVQDIDLRGSIEDTLMILAHKLKHGVQVERSFEPGLPAVEAHGGELNQVWTNLVDNAVQAMDGNGVLEIAAARLGDEVEVRIADSGPGIPESARARIFEPFFTTKPQGVGSGLGLHIVHNIVVNRHRGRIDVDTRPGRTEFRIVLPIRIPKA